MIYLLDTNVISDLITFQSPVQTNVIDHHNQGHILAICRPVYYELLRGLYWTKAQNKLRILHDELIPLFMWIELVEADWQQAAQFWADTKTKGKQLADTDLLVATVTYRQSAVLVTADDDFDVLPITRENWRKGRA